MKLRFATFTFLTLLIFSIASAQHIKINGVVKDSLSLEPIAFAHVSVGNVVTLTNLSGEFVLSFLEMPNANLHVTYLGYQQYLEPVDSSITRIEVLLSQSQLLKEKSSLLSGDTIMAKVFRRFPINNVYGTQRLQAYYKEKLNGNDSMLYLAEGILDIYLPFDVSDAPVKVSALKARKKVVREVTNEGVALVKGHASDMVQSSIWREGSFLNEKNRKYYAFRYTGKKLLGDQDIYIVEFEPKNNKGYITGNVYVDANTFAILKLEYFPDADKSRFWDDIKWIEEFENFDGTYYLVRSSFEGNWWEGEVRFDFSSLLMINEVERVSEEPEMGPVLGEEDLFFKAASENFTDSFWEDYNYIKLNNSEVITFSPKVVSGGN